MKNNFKEMILELRKEKGLNQREIAKKIDEKQSSYCRWENGNSIPNIETLIKIAEFYETSTDYILGLIDENGNKLYEPNQQKKQYTDTEHAKKIYKKNKEIKKT